MPDPGAAGFPPLETERLAIRVFRLSDLGDVQEYAADPLVTRYLRWGPNRDDQTFAFLRDAIARARAPGSRDFDLAVVERSTGRVCGGIGIHGRAPEKVEIGYVLARRVWGRGYATEALRGVLPIAARIGADEVFALVLPSNGASVGVLRRCGFAPVRDVAPYEAWRSGKCGSALVFRLRVGPRRRRPVSPTGPLPAATSGESDGRFRRGP